MTNIRKEAFIKEYRSVYLEDPNFENINDLDLYSWWQWACDWQKAQIDSYLNEVRFELPEDIRRKLFYND